MSFFIKPKRRRKKKQKKLQSKDLEEIGDRPLLKHNAQSSIPTLNIPAKVINDKHYKSARVLRKDEKSPYETKTNLRRGKNLSNVELPREKDIDQGYHSSSTSKNSSMVTFYTDEEDESQYFMEEPSPPSKNLEDTQKSNEHISVIKAPSSEDWETTSSFSGFIHEKPKSNTIRQKNLRRFESSDKSTLLQDSKYMRNLGTWDIFIGPSQIMEIAFWKVKIKHFHRIPISILSSYNYVSMEKVGNSYFVIKTNRVYS